ncbi:MAG: hypothetical protein KZQ75_02875, partial [Candidatus Thiodiazotropha sp. (ex Myrtea spinifera)]|nr:hypothetical protein [Candidatus Thiodiazotropha sp. (ex Myrtea spinifera)]
GARREVWLFQMSDEQRRVALFQAHPKGTSFGAQPEGLGLFLHPAALSFAHVAGYTTLILPCWAQKQLQQGVLD